MPKTPEDDPDIPFKHIPVDWDALVGRKPKPAVPASGTVRERSSKHLQDQLAELFAMTSNDNLSAAEKLKAFELIAKIGDVFKAPEQQAKVEVVTLSKSDIDASPRIGDADDTSHGR